MSSVDTTTLSRLRWRCRRGMRELDEAMLAYLNNHFEQASEEERADFVALQDLQDPELFRLVSGKAKEARYQTILDKISASLSSTN
ncbi:MAG: succinate dehydrogenase assembly factor 2 [Granulosicoccus sp.]